MSFINRGGIKLRIGRWTFIYLWPMRGLRLGLFAKYPRQVKVPKDA